MFAVILKNTLAEGGDKIFCGEKTNFTIVFLTLLILI